MKIKQVFVKDRDVDLPEGAETAPTNTITLPENYDDLELFFEPDAAAGLGHGASGFVSLGVFGGEPRRHHARGPRRVRRRFRGTVRVR